MAHQTQVDPIVRQVVNRCHVGNSNRAVVRYAVSRLRCGYRTFRAMPRAARRQFLQQVVKVHHENRSLYWAVQTGQFTTTEHTCPSCGGRCRCTVPRQYCVHCA